MDRKALEAKLATLRSRGEVKAFVREVEGDPRLQTSVAALARAKGIEEGLELRQVIRRLLDREGEARRPRNPTRLDGGFTCVHCASVVAGGGARVRDHCPFCLHGLHVDEVPGDRASTCGGLLVPEAFTLEGRAGVVISFRCASCGKELRNRAHKDDHLPVQVGGGGAAPEPDLPYEAGRTLPLRVLEVIKREALWVPGATVIVAVSGGLDSTVLLELLVRLQDAHKGRLSVVSFDHGLRPASTHEVAVVGRLASAHGLPFEGVRLELAPGPNLQDRARSARRAALLGRGADFVALGHHQDDQAETVLINLLRGAGTTGLGGMAVKDGPWVRPLLFEPRAVLEAWASIEGIRWVEDPSNADSLRGRIRDLWPALDPLHGDARTALARAARLLARDEQFLAECTDRVWSLWEKDGGLLVEVLHAEHPALVLRLLRRLAGDVAVTAAQLEAALTWDPKEGASLPLTGGAMLSFEHGVLRVVPPGRPL